MADAELVRGQIETKLIKSGYAIVGVDEVGRGCLAGPVFTACVALNYKSLFKLDADKLQLIRDSKTLSPLQRRKVLAFLPEVTDLMKTASASVQEIEELGIVKATFLAMKRALAAFPKTYDMLLIDGNQKIPDLAMAQRAIVKGDSLCYAIAAASILAKETRDAYMRDQAQTFPHYGFDRHVGYATKDHLKALDEHGACPLHRRNFAPITSLVEGLSL